MAKWGEGDPRWIVEERADATNVNNWHWTEKNATNWSKDKLRSLLENLEINDENFSCQINTLTSIDGEASASNRKSKLFFFYEWEIKAEWKGKLLASAKSFNGEIVIPNLSEEHSPADVDINITVKNDADDEAYIIKEFLRTKGVENIRVQLGEYIKDLQYEFTQGMILPKKDTAGDIVVPDRANGINGQLKPAVVFQPQALSKGSSGNLGVKIMCKNLSDEADFKCSIADLYKILTDREMIRAFTTSDAMVDSCGGGRFSLFGGNVVGEFTDLISNQKIGMRWRFKSWPAEHYSTVAIVLTQKNDYSCLKLTQTGIPVDEFERTQEGWKNHYWRSIRQRFGLETSLF